MTGSNRYRGEPAKIETERQRSNDEGSSENMMRQIRLGQGEPILLEEWLAMNGPEAVRQGNLDARVAPFPPPELMQLVSGLQSDADFALHGVTIFEAISEASPAPLENYSRVLDFGCGCGRLARMFKGFPIILSGCDIDKRHIDWINAHLPYMNAHHTAPNGPLPFRDASFECVISVSVFSHLDEAAQRFYLAELHRVTTPGATLLLTIHGNRAIARALTEERIFTMLNVPRDGLQVAAAGFIEGKHQFIIQPDGHLTSDSYKYGITFIPPQYVRSVWSEYFEVVDIRSGAIHDFQDIVVCRRR